MLVCVMTPLSIISVVSPTCPRCDAWKTYITITRLCNMSLVVRKPEFGVSDQVPHKPGCAVTEDG